MKEQRKDTAGETGLLSEAANLELHRADTWNRIRERIDRVAQAPDASAEREIEGLLGQLSHIESCWVYPGAERIDRLRALYRSRAFKQLAAELDAIVDRLTELGDRASLAEEAGSVRLGGRREREQEPGYFTVLLVDPIDRKELAGLRRDLRDLRATGARDLVYEILQVSSFEEAWLAVTCNTDIQAVVMRHAFALRAEQPITHPGVRSRLDELMASLPSAAAPASQLLARALRHLRPELDLYLLTNESLSAASEDTSELFARVFYRFEAAHELHMTLLEGVRRRATAPFFDALRAYADKPIGNFHALPIARGHSVFNSRWIRDFGHFYGPNLFMAESSSTAGGLDSLLEPTGTIKEAQDMAARCFGAQRTFFVTNGTSTANKIVHMALLQPGDVVLIDRNCHKSHHYGLVLAGARPLYLEAFPLQRYAMYGGVPLLTLKQKLLELKRIGQLARVRLIVLTNVTFDGILYQPERVMEELLAIKPDLCFLWDEAWFAYARFSPVFRQRTGMEAAQALQRKLSSSAYRAEYRAFRAGLGPQGLDGLSDAELEQRRLLPDPERARLRVYVTQSTHKSLSALRQASMIHVWDDLFERQALEPFTEAFLAHTSTSPNHQLVASLDVARKQMELEGFGLVKQAIQLALRMRERMASDPLISRYLSVLDQDELIPAQFRPSGFDRYAHTHALGGVERAFAQDEFVLDPTRLTIYTALTGKNGFEFRGDVLMKKLGVQVNHTSINTVLVNATIGVTWGALSFLLDGFRREAASLERALAHASAEERRLLELKVHSITSELPQLPDFSGFDAAFTSSSAGDGDSRAAFFLGSQRGAARYVPLLQAQAELDAGRTLVSTRFVVPYPPGFPILVPGQRVSPAILEFMRKLDVKEVHGYRRELGLAVFTAEALERRALESSATAEEWRELAEETAERWH